MEEIKQQEIPNIPNNPPFATKPKSSFKKVLLIILIFITIGIGLSLGKSYLINKNMARFDNVSDYVTPTPNKVACTQEAKLCPDGSSVGRDGPNCEFTPCPPGKADTTSNLKTYKNEDYHISISYPKDWTTNTGPSYHISFYSPDFQANEFAEQKKGAKIVINLPTKYSYGKDIDSVAKSLYLDCAKAEIIENFIFASYKARKYKINCPSMNQDTIQILIEKGEKVYRITYDYQPRNNAVYLEDINKILATFKFLK